MCAYRWRNHLDTSVSRSGNWAELAEGLPGRTANLRRGRRERKGRGAEKRGKAGGEVKHRLIAREKEKAGGKAQGAPRAAASDRRRPRGPSRSGEGTDGKPGPSPVEAAAAEPIGVPAQSALNRIWQECCGVSDGKGSTSELRRKLEEFLSEARASEKRSSRASGVEERPSKRAKRVATGTAGREKVARDGGTNPCASKKAKRVATEVARDDDGTNPSDDPAVRYDCPQCGKAGLSKMGLAAHHGMLHGKIDWSMVRRSKVGIGTTASPPAREGSANEKADGNIMTDEQEEEKDAREDEQEGGKDAASANTRKPWTDDEEERLKELVMRCGSGKVKWSRLATEMPGKTSDYYFLLLLRNVRLI